MKSKRIKSIRKRAKRLLPSRYLINNIILIIAGSLIHAYGVNSILVPNHFLSGGSLGIALIIHYLCPMVGISLTYILVNIPLVMLGWFKVGHRFMGYTIFGIVVFSLSVQFLQPQPLDIGDSLLAAILAGIISGAGMGVVFRSAGSLGGTDILAIYLNKRWDFRIGWTIFIFNAIILVAAAQIFSLKTALYMLIYVFTTGKIIDTVITGFNQRKQLFIISDKSKELSNKILSQLGRGVTFLEGKGAFTNQQKEVIVSIVTMTELGRIKEMIFETDPKAFVIINDTLEVLGKRHGSKRIY